MTIPYASNPIALISVRRIFDNAYLPLCDFSSVEQLDHIRREVRLSALSILALPRSVLHPLLKQISWNARLITDMAKLSNGATNDK